MQVMHPRCAGLDVNQEMVEACVRLVDGDDVHYEARTFAPTARELTELVEWLAAHQCTHVAMEATGVHWKPAWHALEGQFEIVLADAQQVRQAPSGNRGVNDATWLADLLAYDLIRPLGEVPPQAPLTIDALSDRADRLLDFSSEQEIGATPSGRGATDRIRRRVVRILHALRGLARRQDAKRPPPGKSPLEAVEAVEVVEIGEVGEVGELMTRVIRRLEEVAARVDAIDKQRRELDAIEHRIQALANDDLRKHYEAVQQLSTQVSQSQASMDALRKERSHALVLANRVRALVRSMDIQIGKLDERMTQVGKAEDTIRRTETLAGDTNECLQAAIRLNAEIHRETANLETNSMVLLQALRDEVSTLSIRKNEFETVDKGVRSLTTAVGDVQSRLDTLVAKDRELIAVTERVDALSTALVEEGTQKARRLLQFVGELDNRLNGLNALSTDVDQKIQEQLARRDELETLKRVFDVMYKRLYGMTLDEAAVVERERRPAEPAGVVLTVRRPFAVALFAAVVIGVSVTPVLITRWAARPGVAGAPPSGTSAVEAPADREQVAIDHALRSDSSLKISVPVGAQTLQRQRGLLSRTAASSLPRIYSEDDPDVSRPVPIRQELPPWPRPRSHALQAATVLNEKDFFLPSTSSGLMEVVIGADGHVESAIMIVPIHPLDDRSVTVAARHWQYRPALKQGRPVRYKKAIRVLFR